MRCPSSGSLGDLGLVPLSWPSLPNRVVVRIKWEREKYVVSHFGYPLRRKVVYKSVSAKKLKHGSLTFLN